jgi:hypothetical protein
MRLVLTALTGDVWHAPTTETTVRFLSKTVNPSPEALPANSRSCFNDLTGQRPLFPTHTKLTVILGYLQRKQPPHQATVRLLARLLTSAPAHAVMCCYAQMYALHAVRHIV